MEKFTRDRVIEVVGMVLGLWAIALIVIVASVFILRWLA